MDWCLVYEQIIEMGLKCLLHRQIIIIQILKITDYLDLWDEKD